ncbi:MAG: AAA family ATPase [Pseudomonadales bacterium]|nr:AAA family ATPase [Pseudomonadales bacterium]
MSGEDQGGPNGPAAQRRQLTVLYTDLSDSTHLTASLEWELYAGILSDLKTVFADVITRFGGIVEQVQGDGMLAVFGLEAHPDDGRRAVSAALELNERVASLPVPAKVGRLHLHSGVHASTVLVGPGDDVTGKHVLVGDAPNIAARLSARAGPGEILVTENALGTDHHFFRKTSSYPLTVRGLAQPLRIFAVAGHHDIATRYEARRLRGLAPLIGRDQDLARLRAVAAHAASGIQQQVWLVGAPGLGKTRLANEFLDHQSDALLLKAHCESFLEAEPLQPIRQWLKAAMQNETFTPLPHGSPLSQEETTRLQGVLTGGIESPPLDEVIEALAALFAALSQRQALIVFVDDWQWADDACRRILADLRTRNLGAVLFLFASREASVIGNNPGTHVITLEPLVTTDTQVLVRTLRPGMADDVCAQLVDAAGGNPLFAEELCHALNAAAELTRRAPASIETGWIPLHIKSLIQSRLEKLPAEAAETVRLAALIGKDAPLELLETSLGRSVTAQELNQISDEDLLYLDSQRGALHFKHGMTRDIVVESTGAAEARRLHAAICRALLLHAATTGEDISQPMAIHCMGAHDFEDAARHAIRGGDEAMAALALDKARAQYQLAFEALERLPAAEAIDRERLELARRLSAASNFDAQNVLVDIFTQVRASMLSIGNRDALIEAEYQLAHANYLLGNATEAVSHALDARKLAATSSRAGLRAQIDSTLGQAYSAMGRYNEAIEFLDAALCSQRPYCDNPRTSAAYAYGLACRGMLLGDRGQFDLAYADFTEASTLLSNRFHEVLLSVLEMQATVQSWQGLWEQARESSLRAAGLADRVGSRYMTAMAQALLGYVGAHLGDADGADAMKTGLGWIEGHDMRLWISMQFGRLAEVLLETGRTSEALHFAEAALHRAKQFDCLGEASACCVQAALSTGDESRRWFETARRAAGQRDSRRELALIDYKQAVCLANRGEAADAGKLAARSKEAFSGLQMPWHADRAQRLLLRL